MMDKFRDGRVLVSVERIAKELGLAFTKGG